LERGARRGFRAGRTFAICAAIYAAESKPAIFDLKNAGSSRTLAIFDHTPSGFAIRINNDNSA
jgi:hypothetical protein